MASVQNLVTERKYAKVRAQMASREGAEAWNNYEFSQRNRKVLANQWKQEKNMYVKRHSI